MNRRIFLQVIAPAGVICAMLLLGFGVTAWYVQRLQTNRINSLTENASSLEAARRLEINLRRLRFHCFLYLIDPDPETSLIIQEHERDFENWLERAKQSANLPAETILIRAIEDGYERYRDEFERLKQGVAQDGPRRDFHRVDEANPVAHIVNACRDLFRVNENQIVETSLANERIHSELRWILLLLGSLGPICGLAIGFAIARGLSRSITHLRVHVRDMAQRMDLNAGTVRLDADGNLDELNREMQHVLQRVEEVMQRVQRQQEAVLRAQQLAAVGQLAAGIAHEVRNPLTSIKMLVEAALRTRNPRPFTEENLRIIHGEVARLERTVQGFLAFARAPVLRRDEVDLRDVVRQAVELIRARAAMQKVEIAWQPPPVTRPAAVDRDQICTVLVNLAINALDAMPHGGRLQFELDTAPDGAMEIMVADSGPGISAELSEQLFTPFFSTKATGTGLGLCISKRIVEEHGGRLTFRNCPNGGAAFMMTLPLPALRENHVLVARH